VTSRERLLKLLAGEIPDCVPVMPDMSNMIPARLTGKPFWEVYLYNNPNIFDAYIDCAKYFDIDSLMDGYIPIILPDPDEPEGPPWEEFIVARPPGRIVTQESYVEGGKRVWRPRVTVYYEADSPTGDIPPAKLGLPEVPERWEPVEGRKEIKYDAEDFKRFKEKMGEQGLVGAGITSSCALYSVEEVYEYYDHPEKHEEWARERVEEAEKYFQRVMASGADPDFICVGGSGSLVFQTVEIFRQLAFPAVRRVIELATEAGLATHMHSCGPEKELVKIMAEETGLSVIDPLERPPMGDCDLAELKRLYGDKLILKGNLHTTDVLLRGSVEDVVAASKKCIDDAAEGGGFILSSGDQCGRDTPDENIRAMVETARTYGRY